MSEMWNNGQILTEDGKLGEVYFSVRAYASYNGFRMMGERKCYGHVSDPQTIIACITCLRYNVENHYFKGQNIP